MARLSPQRRAEIWQRHIDRYFEQHGDLDGAAVDALNAARSALTPSLLSNPTPADRAAMHQAAAQVQAALGKDETNFLLYQLGPRDNTFASAEPLSMKVASFVRNTLIADHRNWDCECHGSWGCGGWLVCTTQESMSVGRGVADVRLGMGRHLRRDVRGVLTV